MRTQGENEEYRLRFNLTENKKRKKATFGKKESRMVGGGGGPVYKIKLSINQQARGGAGHGGKKKKVA